MNNTAFQLQQALQTASWNANQWQTFFYAQDDFRVDPGPDAEPRPALRAARPCRSACSAPPTRRAWPRWCRGPVQKDTNNWAPRVGFNWSPRSSNSLLGDGKTVFRGGFGMGYDVLFYNLLTVNGSNYPRIVTASVFNVVGRLPEPAAGRRQRRVQPARRLHQLARGHAEPRLEVLELLGRARARRVRGRGRATRAAGAGTASTRSTPTRRS